MKIKFNYLVFINIILFVLIMQKDSFSLGLTLSPLEYDLLLTPGTRQELPCNLINETDKVLEFECYLADVYQEESGQYSPIVDDKNYLLTQANPKISCLKWLKLNIDKISVPPQSRKEIKATLSIPSSARIGSYAAVIVFKSVGKQLQDNASEGMMPLETELSLVTGTVIFLEIRRRGVTERRSGKYGETESFSIKKENEYFSFQSKFINLGNNFIEGKGKIEVYKDGKKVIEFPLGQGRGRVLPGFKINFTSLVPLKLFTPGEYEAISYIDYGGLRISRAIINYKIDEKSLFKSTEAVNQNKIVDPTFLSIDKGTFETSILANSTRNLTLSVYNESKKKLLINAFVKDSIDNVSAKFSQYIKVNPESFELLPYQQKSIKINIVSPKELLDGNKYVRIDFLPQSADGVGISEEMKEIFGCSSFIILNNKKGEQIKKALIKNITLNLVEKEKGSLMPGFVIQYQNTGNVHINPVCEIILRLLENTESKAATLEGYSGEIFLSSGSTLDVLLPGMDGMSKLGSARNVKPGKYEAEIIIKDSEKEILKEKKTFELVSE